MNWFEVQIDPKLLEEAPFTPMFCEAASRAGMDPELFMKHLLTEPVTISLKDKRGVEFNTLHLPGQVADGPCGPERMNVMIIGKMPGYEEIDKRQFFVGPAGNEMRQAFAKHDYAISGQVYFSNALKFQLPASIKTAPKEYLDFDRTILLHEISIVRPKYILLMGAEAVKAVIGSKASLTKLRSAIITLGDCKAVVTVNPINIIREPERYRTDFLSDIRLFCDLLRGQETPRMPVDVDYFYIRNIEDARAYRQLCEARNDTMFGMDCEWAGRGPKDPNGYLRTIQVSARPKEAAVFVLRDQYGKPVLSDQMLPLLDELRGFLCKPGNKIGGHFFRTDLAWLIEVGLDLRPYFAFDTMLAGHTLDENSDQGLEAYAVRYTDMGRYDLTLQMWVDAHMTRKKKKRKGKNAKPSVEKEGYGPVPDDILLPYAACDADCERRLMPILMALLAKEPTLERLFYTVLMPANLPILDMELNGILVDKDRLIELRKVYEGKKSELVQELRTLLGNPNFNFRSTKDVQELLFRPAPHGLGLTPIKSTDATDGVEWDVAMQRYQSGELKIAPQPATDGESLRILAPKCPEAQLISDVKTIDQVTKNFLRPPNSEGEYDDGLMGYIDSDGRMRTHISQILETARFASFKPNLTNLPHKQETEVSRIFGETQLAIRSAFIASQGCVLIEGDYKSAEVVALAELAGETSLIKAARTSDIHSKVAVDLFKLDCTPAEVKEKYPALRTCAKTVVFGVPYSRGAKAVAREIQKAGVDCTAEAAKGFLSEYFVRYPNVERFIKDCKRAVKIPGYVENPFGLRRRFYGANITDPSVIAAMEREAGNHPVQSTVACCLSVALYNLWAYRNFVANCPPFRILLSIHDAILLEIPAQFISEGKTILRTCMESVVIPVLNCSLAADIEIYLRWGEKVKKEELLAVGVPESYFERKAA